MSSGKGDRMEQIMKACIGEWKNGSIITINDMRNKIKCDILGDRTRHCRYDPEELDCFLQKFSEGFVDLIFRMMLALPCIGFVIIIAVIGSNPGGGMGAARAEFCKKAMGFNFPQAIRKVITEQKVDEILADCGWL